MKSLVLDSNALIALFDVWIAAGALETGSVLLTRDGHFANIPMIRTIG